MGKSGVYPMSGPHPSGPAPIRGQMEWGQGERGAAGYYDHGTSELSMDSGAVVGGFDETWPGAPEAGSAVPAVIEVPVAEWPAFCAWLTENCRGLLVTIEHQENGESSIEGRDRPFEALTAHLLENCVTAITIVAEGKPRKTRLNVAGPQRLNLYRNPAGWPTRLEIEHANGRALIYFTGKPENRPGLSSNAWGE